jgi:hypothetical protein
MAKNREEIMVGIVGGLLVAFAFTLVFLQAIDVIPASDSPGKDRLKTVFFVAGAVYFFICAAATRPFPSRGGTPMPIWASRTICGSLGVILLALAVLEGLGISH